MILDTIELYNFDSNMFESLDSIRMSTPRSLHTATYIPSPYNQVLIVGGTNNGTNTLNTYEIFSVSTLSLIKTGTIQSKRAFHTATLLKNNVDILINGGYSLDEAINVSSQSMAPCEIFNMTTMASTIVANMNVPRASHTAILLPNSGAVLCCGGVSSSNAALASCERYTP
jgi:WD40 repeat protein